jgi:hypothetical protein
VAGRARNGRPRPDKSEILAALGAGRNLTRESGHIQTFFAGYLSTEVLAAGTPANEPRGLVTAAEGTVKLGEVESGWCDNRRLEKRAPVEKAVTNVVLASLVLCMILILLSAAGSETPQKAIAKRPRH